MQKVLLCFKKVESWKIIYFHKFCNYIIQNVRSRNDRNTERPRNFFHVFVTVKKLVIREEIKIWYLRNQFAPDGFSAEIAEEFKQAG